jgi:hypothetical protein
MLDTSNVSQMVHETAVVVGSQCMRDVDTELVLKEGATDSRHI